VRLRFASSDGTAIATDRILCTYTVVSAALGYDNASVWVDESNGTSSGTTAGVDAIVSNRSDDFDNAQTVADALGYSTITITPGNSVTLSAALQGYTIENVQATLNGGSQNVDSTRFNGGFLTGTFARAGSGVPTFSNCNLNNVTSDRVACLNNCGILGTFTLAEAGVYVFNDAQAAGSTGIATIDFASLGGATVSMQRWSGDLTITGMASGDTLNLNCTSGDDIIIGGADGTVNISGTVGTITDNRTGSPTLNNNGITLANINSQVDTAISDAALATAAALATVDGNVDAILVDTNELQTDWANGGRLDTILDDIYDDTSSTLPGQLTTIANYLDTEIAAILEDTGTTIPATITALNALIVTLDTVCDAIKVKTDQLTFTVANQVDANAESINAVEVTGAGTAGDPWT